MYVDGSWPPVIHRRRHSSSMHRLSRPRSMYCDVVVIVVVVSCKRLCPLNSRSSVLRLELVRHSRCSFGFLKHPFLILSRDVSDASGGDAAAADGVDAVDAVGADAAGAGGAAAAAAGDGRSAWPRDGSTGDGDAPNSDAAIRQASARHPSDRHHPRPYHAPISHGAMYLNQSEMK